ncbi:MAG TPA: polysaccharide biosynthesis/export family protein [Dongiaceae bacterium]|nr:polysaccharide biosynthesis/export family protein [Dongiaceae bacterium]
MTKFFRPLMLMVLLAGLTPSVARAVDADYKLNPGDILQITVWKEEGLDRETLVLPDGTVAFPLVGTLHARGKTVGQLQDEIKAGLQKAIPDAPVTVVVKNALGNTVDVIGQVLKPGEFVAGHPLTVMQALSLAGGLTPYASEKRISIVRHNMDGKDQHIEFPYYEDILDGKNLDKDIVLQPGDVVLVPASSLF